MFRGHTMQSGVQRNHQNHMSKSVAIWDQKWTAESDRSSPPPSREGRILDSPASQPAPPSHLLLSSPSPWGAARQSLVAVGGGGDSPSPVHATVGAVLGRAPRQSGTSRDGAWGDCDVEDGIPPAVIGGGWILGRRLWTWWRRRSLLAGLVVSLGLVVKNLAGGGGHGSTGLHGTVVSCKV
jgi:hypothetical protein